MAITTKELLNQILETSFQRKTGHIGSCITAAPILNAIYTVKQQEDIVILSAGHSGLALYLTLKAHGFPIDVESKGTHPDYSPDEGIYASTGSLGHGIGIAVGYAIADRSRNVYCVCTDGESTEGSLWEAIDIAARLKLSNLKIIFNCNGYSAYQEISSNAIVAKLLGFDCAALLMDMDELQLYQSLTESVPNHPLAIVVKTNSNFADIEGLEAHYLPLKEPLVL